MSVPNDSEYDDTSLHGTPPPRDTFTRAWLRQVMLRMRRELCWMWRHQTPTDRLAELLDRQSLADLRQRFFAEDPTASYLEDRIRQAKLPSRGRGTQRGSLAWLAREMQLNGGEIFVVALALAAARDAATGEMIAALHGGTRQQLPTLAMAQWLWQAPEDLLPLRSPAHPLFARGILRRGEAENDWNAQISMPAQVAQIFEGRLAHPPAELENAAEFGEHPPAEVDLALLASRMRQLPRSLSIIPVALPFATGALDLRRAGRILRQVASLTGRPIYSLRENVATTVSTLESAGIYCWLRGADLLLPSYGMPADAVWQSALRPFPIYVFAQEHEEPGGASSPRMLPLLRVPALGYAARRELWQRELERHRLVASAEAVRECAYRFRLDAAAISDAVHALCHIAGPLTLEQMIAACQQQVGWSIGPGAALVVPRFRAADLVLNPERKREFNQLLSAMRNLSRVHADWGTGQAWGDAGISALFAGAPGTGKTMAAEVLAAELQLPMYRVDLSQVVNKYIGETEKNLRKLFDAAEQADLVLFFDEAEALFGQRMESRTANDRFANIEVSYLLERMERFRGLAILATNRKKDLDEAFLRRLRYVLEFPLPAEAERLEIWKKSIPSQVSTTAVDFQFLAHEFALSGGNIRSIVLQACLDSASASGAPALQTETVMDAIDREYEKMGRPLTREQKALWFDASQHSAPRPIDQGTASTWKGTAQ